MWSQRVLRRVTIITRYERSFWPVIQMLGPSSLDDNAAAANASSNVAAFKGNRSLSGSEKDAQKRLIARDLFKTMATSAVQGGMSKSDQPMFTPALGAHEHTADYDRVIAVMTREQRWRSRMLEVLAPSPNLTIVDLGSGTGSFAILVKDTEPTVRMIAVDPDPAVRAIAEDKAGDRQIEFLTAMGNEPIASVLQGTVDAVTCSLVLHQCPMEAKIGILANAYRLLKPGGRLLVSDYGEQRTLLMHLLFKQVREVDGYENTRPNKDGMIPSFMADAGFERVEELKLTQTPTGSISLYSGWKAV